MAASDLPEAGFGPGVAVPAQKAGEAVIDRAFAVLSAFDAEHRVLSLAGLVQRTGLPRSTALRLARKLTETGAL
ncbi:IclR-like helix-turn-helix domain-containing protein [Nonomuraea fuscirosea]|uniref:IclR-like helix-turn-helix domain-containing protein n=1 Tax=Nonomuraea fuscirosea TaxID=1291556 RepID=A0A2T0MQ41_9ACTN|nr:helix-turn-helix domain-containing protein [Nonomuraea fuscirosea]PRX60264.1 IclR-like helix-turn-helix domain-containing protein [Nonomuraea fuscirosea]